MIVLALFGCTPPSPVSAADGDGCDPRALAPGEVRARQIPCGDELISGGEGRVGDWLLENAHARYVMRGTYAALTLLGQEGGTLIDAARPGGPDLLLEYAPDGDRTAIAAVNEDGEARLELPGFTYRLGADDGVLHLDGAPTGTLQGRVGVTRTGPSLGDGASFLGLDGAEVLVSSGGGAPAGPSFGSTTALEGVTRLALTPEEVWPEGAYGAEVVDADTLVVLDGDALLYRMAVTDGVADGWLPVGAGAIGEREGCVYQGLTSRGCGWLQLRVADDTGADIAAVLTDGRGTRLPVPRGGGRVPVGPDPRQLWIWAGPTHSVYTARLPGGDVALDVTLVREVAADDAVLAALVEEVAPDAGVATTPTAAASLLAGEGVGFAVLVADDEVPTADIDPHDALVAVAGSRAAGIVWSWPWSPNSKRAAHGAVPWQGLDARDLLAASEGGQSGGRITAVDSLWLERAFDEAPAFDWDPRPDAFYLRDPSGLDAYVSLLDAWVDVAPIGPRTWIEVDADRNLVAYEAGIIDARTTAGNGPRLTLTADGSAWAGWDVGLRLDAPRWMGMHTVTLRTNTGEVLPRPVEGAGAWKWRVPAGTTWVIAVAEGRQASPGAGEPAWAVSAPLWLRQP